MSDKDSSNPHEMQLSLAQALDLSQAWMDAFPFLNEEQLAYYTKDPKALARDALYGFRRYPRDLKELEGFWWNNFKLRRDFSDLLIPKKRDGFDWPIVIWAGISPRFCINLALRHFRVEMNQRIYELVDQSDPWLISGSDYAVRSKAIPEVEDAWRGVSAEEATKKLRGGKTRPIGLSECILLELWHFLTNGTHLNSFCSTICAATVLVGGRIPTVEWRNDATGTSSGMLWIDVVRPGQELASAGIREVID